MSSSKRFKFSGITSGKSKDNASKTPPLIVRFYDPDVQAKDAHDRSMEQMLAWEDSKLENCHNYIQMLFPVPEGSAYNWEAPIIDRDTIEAFRSRSELRNRLRRAFERMLDFYGFTVTMQPEKEEFEPKVEKYEGIKLEEETQDIDVDMTEASATAEEKSKDNSQSTSAAPSTSDAPATSPASSVKGTNTTDITDIKGKAPEKPSTSPTKASFPPGAHSQPSPFNGYYILRAPHWRKRFRGWAGRFDHNHLRITRILRCLRVLGLQTECDAFYKALGEVFDDPAISISERSMMYWSRAVTRPLYIAPDDTEVEWLKKWEKEQAEKKGSEEVDGKVYGKVEKEGDEVEGTEVVEKAK